MTPSSTSPQDLLSSPLPDSPLTRKSSKESAASADDRTSFAHKLRSKRERADAERTNHGAKSAETDDSRPGAQTPAEANPSEATPKAETADSLAADEQSSDPAQAAATADGVASQDQIHPESESAAAGQVAQHDFAVEVKTQPETIHALSTLLLQGQSTLKFALIEPNFSPDAARGAKAPTAASRKSEARGSTTSQAEPASEDADGPVRRPDPSRNSSVAQNAKPEEPVGKPGVDHQVKPEDQSGFDTRSSSEAVPQADSTKVVAAPPTAAADVKPVAANPEQPGSPPQVTVGSSAGNLLDRLTPGANVKASAPPPVGQEQANQAFAAQLHRGLSAALNQKSGAVTVRLNPESLGQLKIRVHVNQGSVTAAFEVSSRKTRDLLNNSLASLHKTLQDKGLGVHEMKVTVAPSLPQRDIGLPAAHQHSPQDPGNGAWTGDPGQQSGQQWGNNTNPGAFDQMSGGARTADHSADLAVNVSIASPDSVVGRAQYVALPDGRVGVIALA